MKASQNTEKNRRRRTKLLPPYMQTKLAITLSVFLLAFLALAFVIYKQIKTNNEDYNKIVLSQRQASYASRIIPYRRGNITDRNGTLLATSQRVYNLILDPAVMYSGKDRRYLNAGISALCDYFGYDESDIRSSIEGKEKKSYVKYTRGLSYDEKSGFEKFQSERNKEYQRSGSKERIRGIWFEEEYKRTYPYGSLASSVIGFASGDGTQGTGGVEQYYNSTLIGTNGREYGYLDVDTKLQSVIREAEDGSNIVTTINYNIQSSVERYLDEWQNNDVGSKVAAAIVMDPRTSEVLAMASTKKFDLNNPRRLDPEEYTETVLLELGRKEAVGVYRREHPDEKAITEAEASEHYTRDEILSYGQQVAWNQVWRNVVVSDTYEPGSTAKPFTIAGALEEGVITPDTTFNCQGYIELNDGIRTWRIRCNNREGHGVLDAQHAIMRSCNVYMMQTAFQEGAENFIKYQHIFGFGEKTGIDLPAEADTAELIYNAESIGRTALATNSFGQNYNVTMIQMAAAYCSILNGGSYYRPHVVKEIQNSQGVVIEEKKPELMRVTASKETCSFLRDAMFQTVEDGTGKLGQIQGFHVGGKTGTAQKLPRSAMNYLVSFAGFAPVEDPRLLVYVIVDTPNLAGEAQASASFATKIEQRIMNDALQFLNISPQGETDPENSINKRLFSQSEGISEGTEAIDTTEAESSEAFDGTMQESAEAGESPLTDEGGAFGEDERGGVDELAALPEAVPVSTQ